MKCNCEPCGDFCKCKWFQRLLGKKGSVRVLGVFLGNREIPVTRSGLEKLSGMSQPTVSRTVEEFLEIGIIEESKDDSPKMFRLNMEHPGATGLISAYDALYAHVNEIQEASEEFDPNMAHSNEGSPFVELFRYPTNGALLSELLRQPDTELTAADIARAADVDPSTVGDNIPILVRIGVVDKTESGRHDQYQLNRGHPAVEGFLKVIKEIQDEHSPRDPDSYLYVLMNAVGAEEIADIEAKTQESDGQATTDGM